MDVQPLVPREDIEVGKYACTPREERICQLCHQGVESEEHHTLLHRGIRRTHYTMLSAPSNYHAMWPVAVSLNISVAVSLNIYIDKIATDILLVDISERQVSTLSLRLKIKIV